MANETFSVAKHRRFRWTILAHAQSQSLWLRIILQLVLLLYPAFSLGGRGTCLDPDAPSILDFRDAAQLVRQR